MYESKQSHILIDKEIKYLAEKYKLIEPFNVLNLSGCSYDLCAGSILKSRNRASTFNLSAEGFTIESGECVTIESLEEVNLKDTLLFGVIANKHSLVAKGLFHPITTIDPGFKGKLAITFILSGNIRYHVKQGDSICNIFFYPIYPTPENIYGISQKPSYREGSTDIALIIDKPKQSDDDSALENMYGLPVKKLYDKIREIENRFEIASLHKELGKKKEIRLLLWTLFVAVLAAIISTGLQQIDWPRILNALKKLFS